MAAHKHAEVIKAWADGAQIEFRCYANSAWRDVPGDPVWKEAVEYRVKPAGLARVYPVTQMVEGDFYAEMKPMTSTLSNLIAVANAALRHACDAGQILTREEFEHAVGDRKVRDMRIAEAVARKFAEKVVWTDDLAAIIAEVQP